MRNYLLFLFIMLSFASCTNPAKEESKQQADAIYHNGKVYTVNDGFEVKEAFAVKDGKFIAVASNNEIFEQFQAETVVDLQGAPVYPGLIDAHCHFYRYGLGLTNVDLVGTTSFNEIIEKIKEHRQKYPDTPWIIGRGWDQNDWQDKKFPTKKELDTLFPNTPVILTRIDGHAALVNQKALDLAGITAKTSILGGKIILENGQPTGVLVDNAIDLVSDKIPEPTYKQKLTALQEAEKNCFAVGLTTVDDAGLDKSTIDLIDSLQKANALQMRIYAMVNPTQENKAYYFANGPYKTDRLNVTAFKIYGDGALGSRGASLLAPYHDDHDNFGFLLNTPDHFAKLAQEIYTNNFQMNTHCIGDSANRIILDIYAQVLQKENDRRWRIEHAQVVSNPDVSKFEKYNIIPSVQPTHATSDMYWAEDRLGPERIKTAYAYQELLKAADLVALGSDFPVEDINPMLGFYAAVARQDANNFPEGGFQPENKLSREDALRGMTIWAAFSNFEEKEKGSIETGKMADFVILDQDLMTAPVEQLKDTKVKQTYVGGKKVY